MNIAAFNLVIWTIAGIVTIGIWINQAKYVEALFYFLCWFALIVSLTAGL